MLDSPVRVSVNTTEDDARVLVHRVAKLRENFAEVYTCTLMSTLTLIPFRVYYEAHYLAQLKFDHGTLVEDPSTNLLRGTMKSVGSLNVPKHVEERLMTDTCYMYRFECQQARAHQDFLLGPGIDVDHA
jgi:hypothetical protein